MWPTTYRITATRTTTATDVAKAQRGSAVHAADRGGITMKRIIAAALIAMSASVAWAHSGGTDAAGCHYNHKTGEYHCH